MVTKIKEQKVELSEETKEALRKILTDLNKILDQLPGQAKAAAGILATILGYGKPKVKSEFTPEDVSDMIQSLESLKEVGAKLGASTRQKILAIIRQLQELLGEVPYYKAPYKLPYYKAPSHYYYYGYPRKKGYGYPYAKLGQNFTEHVQLLEAVEDTEGLQWKVILLRSGLTRGGRREYTPQAIRDGQRLFANNDVPCYMNHPSSEEEALGRKLEDKAGWYEDVRVEEVDGSEALVGTLNVLQTSPLAPLLREAWERGKPELVGFSFNGKGTLRNVFVEGRIRQIVENLEEVFSVDAVAEPAAGGRPVALLANMEREEQDMIEGLKTKEELLALLNEVNPELAAQLEEQKPKMYCAACGWSGAEAEDKTCPSCGGALEPYKAPAKASGLGEQEVGAEEEIKANVPSEIKAFEEKLRQLEEQNKILQCSALLRETLAQSTLPDPIKGKIERKFANRVFEEAELKDTLREEEEVYSQLQREKPVSRVKIGTSELDKMQKAMDGLFEGTAVDGVQPFRSLKEAYAVFKGIPILDVEVSEIIRESYGFSSSGRLLEAITATTFANLLGDSITRRMIKWYREPLYDDWRLIASSIVDVADVRAQERIRIPGYNTLPEVDWGGTYAEAVTASDEKITIDLTKKGILESITDKVIINDDLNAIREIPRRLALAAKAGLYKAVFDLLEDNATYDVDSKTLFHADHNNQTTSALSYAAIGTAKAAMRNQKVPGTTELPLSLAPRYLVVPPALEALARTLRDSEYAPKGTAFEGDTNIHRGTFDVIVVPTFDDPNNWYMVADPALCPTIEVDFYGGREPQLFTEAPNTGSQFTADKVTYKVRFIWGVDLLDYRGFYGGIVA